MRNLTIGDPGLIGISRQSYEQVVLADSPAGLWMLNETSGTQATDLSGNGRHGSYVAGYTLAQAGPGSVVSKAVALAGEGSGTGRVTFPNSAASSLAGDFTVGLLLKMTGFDDAWNLLSVISPTQFAQPWQVSLGTAAKTANKWMLRIGSTGSTETTIWTEAGSDIGTGWHHFALRASGSSPTTWSILVDGIVALSTTSSVARAVSADVLSLGRRTATSTQRGRTGRYCGLYVVGSALSDVRVAAHAAVGLMA